MGGVTTSGEVLKDIWNSSDGIIWSQVLSSAPYSARYHNTVEIFDNKIWVIGGYDDNFSVQSDVLWSSSDGINWVHANVDNFDGIAEHASLAFKDKLWIIAGYNKEEVKAVWAFD